MEHGYTSQRNILILLALLKKKGIKKIIVSPGTTNVQFVASVQFDDFFELYSAVDERSAAYMACGLAAESGEPVVLSCTGATASRNYYPGLTEAFYRHLPVLAVTSLGNGTVGCNIPQIIDRSVVPKDIARISLELPAVHTESEAHKCMLLANRALQALTAGEGGPAHINLPADFSTDFSVQELPNVQLIERFELGDNLPTMPENKQIAIFVGAHRVFSAELTKLIERFCELYDAVVLCDHSSNYHGSHRVDEPIVGAQEDMDFTDLAVDICIDLGSVTGNYFVVPRRAVWCVSVEGNQSDRWGKLAKVFAMREENFFAHYVQQGEGQQVKSDYLAKWRSAEERIRQALQELPFSNCYVAQQSAALVPQNSLLYLGILNSLRVWDFFKVPESVLCEANTGGFGIDGTLSSLLGAALACPERICFGMTGDLGFFYDMNALGSRHVGRNLRVLLVNNGKGTEFRMYWHPGNRWGEDSDEYVAAARHFGNKSPQLVKHYAEDLGFEYLAASTKEEFQQVAQRFFSPKMQERPMLLEVFTDSQLESEALYQIRHLQKDFNPKKAAKKAVKEILGDNQVQRLKHILGR